MWHMKDKIIGWYDEGQWTWGRVNGRYFDRRNDGRGLVDVEIMGSDGWWMKINIGFDLTISVKRGEVWVWFEGRGWRRCGK